MKNSTKTKRRKSYTFRTCAVYILIIIAAVSAVSAYCAYRYYSASLESRARLAGIACRQMKISVDQKLETLENSTKLLLTDDISAGYDPTNSAEDGYEAAQTEKYITDHLTSLSLLNNYCDFAIVYRGNSSAGLLSAGTKQLLGEDDHYATLEDCLGESKTVWVTGLSGDFMRIYYLKRIHENAVFIASFYTSELSNVLISVSQPEAMRVFLTDSSDTIIYSTENLIGEAVDSKYVESGETDGYSIIDTDFAGNVEVTENGWKIITVTDTADIWQIIRKSLTVCFAVLLAALLSLGIFLIITPTYADNGSESSPMRQAVDLLTGLHNTEAAENLIADKIETCISGSTLMLALVKISNLNLIEESYGSAGVNEAVLKVSQALSTFYPKQDGNIVGRTGENEFVVFADFTEYDLFSSHDKLKSSLSQLDQRLSQCELTDGRGMINCIIGAAVYPDSSTDYDELFGYAKQSLSQAEKNISDNRLNTRHVLHKMETSKKGGQRV